jgi:hypothetical protein
MQLAHIRLQLLLDRLSVGLTKNIWDIRILLAADETGSIGWAISLAPGLTQKATSIGEPRNTNIIFAECSVEPHPRYALMIRRKLTSGLL